jgi:hypothetical protein
MIITGGIHCDSMLFALFNEAVFAWKNESTERVRGAMWGEHESMIKPTTFGSLATIPKQMETHTLHQATPALYIIFL